MQFLNAIVVVVTHCTMMYGAGLLTVNSDILKEEEYNLHDAADIKHN
jgi:hypothetical protein